jgi:hypothetical protein
MKNKAETIPKVRDSSLEIDEIRRGVDGTPVIRPGRKVSIRILQRLQFSS